MNGYCERSDGHREDGAPGAGGIRLPCLHGFAPIMDPVINTIQYTEFIFKAI